MTDNTPKIKLIIDKDWPGLSVFIRCAERDDNVEGVISAIRSYAEGTHPAIPVLLDENMKLLPQSAIVRLYVENRHVMVETVEETYESRKTLRQLEEVLDPARFVRISKSETININQVKQFDFSAAGTIGVDLNNGETTWVARRRMKDVKMLIEGKGGEAHGS